MTPQLDRAPIADLETLLELMRAYYLHDGHTFEEPKARAALVGLLEDERHGAVWLVRIDGAVAGYVAICLGYSLEFGGRDAFIDEFFLRAGFRGRGWGRWTLQQVEAKAKQMGVQALHLQVVAGNERAARLYRSAGYQPQDRLMLTKNLAA